MATKYIIHFKSHATHEIDEKLYNRFKNRARRGEILELDGGALMSEQIGSNWDLIEVIRDPYDIDLQSGHMGDSLTFDEVIRPETREEETEKPETTDDENSEEEGEEKKGEDKDEKPELITLENLKKVIEESNLSPKDFAASIGYSPQAVRMAVKEGRISHPFSDKVREVYKL